MVRISISKTVCIASMLVLMLTGTAVADERKDATQATKAANDKLLKYLPFGDKQAFDDAHKGFVAALPGAPVKGEAGNLIWNPDQHDSNCRTQR